MSNTKHLADLLKVCSILPALVIMPAMAETEIIEERVKLDADKVYQTDVLAKNLNGANGAVFEVASGVSLVFKDDAVFQNNTSTSFGGAIRNSGNVSFEDDVMFVGNTAKSHGGAIYNTGEMEFDGTATFTGNSGSSLGNIFANAEGAKMTFNKGIVVDNNGAILESGTQNGIQTSGELVITGGDAVFTNNKASGIAGISAGSKLTIDAGKSGKILFENNTSQQSTVGLYSMGSVTTLTADLISFKNNVQTDGKSKVYGGALYNGGSGADQGVVKLMANNIVFEGNKINGFQEGHQKIGGAAIYNRGGGDQASVTETVVGLEDGTSTILFKDNSSAQHGGAIFARTDDGKGFDTKLTLNGNIEFSGNQAGEYGGAIMNWTDGRGGLTDINIVGNVSFEGNIAGKEGGAIFNSGTIDLSNAVAEFENNIAKGYYGGAIYNTSAGNITKLIAEFDANKVVNVNYAMGGAIANIGKIGEITGEFDENSVQATYSDISTSAKGGAIYTYASASIGSVVADFEGNSAISAGEAIGGAIVNDGKIDKLHQVESGFVNNTANGEIYGWAGALYNSQSATIGELLAKFEGNSVKGGAFAAGGAVINYGTIDTMAGDFVKNTVTASAEEGSAMGGALVNFGTIKALSGNFISNEATAATDEYASGGAISNYSGAITMVGDNLFHNNTADYGGAIENYETLNLTGRNTFTGNRANFKGAAIYNDAAGVVNMSGDNTFANNVAGKGANDIHNDGVLNITDGTTTFGGGVSGNGTLTLGQGATLDIGTSLIHQDSIDLYGTVKVSLLNAGNDDKRAPNYGKFHSDDITVDLGAKFELSVGAVGTYNIWGAAEVAKDQVFVGSIYEIAEMDANGVRIVTKSVDTIAEEQGLSTQASGAVVGLANANSGKAHQVSLALQEALNAGDAEYVERETKKLNPTDKPVAQAAATSVQNQVLALTAGRMAGGVPMGRAGGDESSQENGFWIQGLFNKSKMGDDFHGYTRGVALGADTQIDRKWTIGGGLATNNSDVHADGSHTDIDSKTVFLYGQYKPNNWFVNATATYNMAEYTEHKNSGGVALMDTYDVDSYGVQVMTGYDFTPGITTEAGVRYLNVSQDAYTQESGFQVGAVDTKFLSGVAGLKYAFAIENDWAIQLRPELRAAATYDFVSDDAYATVVMPGVASYQVETERLSRMGGEFGIGLTAQYKGMEVSLMYDLDLHRDYTSQTGMIKFRGRF